MVKGIHYDSKEAKEKYAGQLISLSEKVFLLILTPFFGYFLAPDKVEIWKLGIAVFVMMCVGLYFRHQGLKILDDINTKKIKIITNEAKMP